MQASDVPTPPSGNATTQIRFDGTAMDLAMIMLRNVLLSLVTIGVYRFWGRVNARRYLWQHVQVGEHRLAYTGTGGELLRGFAKLVGLILGVLVVAGLLSKISPALDLLVTPLYLAATPAAVFGAMRYRLSRTSLRNIRFGLGGSIAEFVQLSMKGLILSVLSLGFYWPRYQHAKNAYLVGHITWGTQPFRYDGKLEDLTKRYLSIILPMIFTLGFYAPWQIAWRQGYIARHTWIGDAHLEVDIRGGELLMLILTLLAAVLLTFGLALPWATNRAVAFRAERTSIVGSLDFAAVAQSTGQVSAAADSMLDDSLGAGLEL